MNETHEQKRNFCNRELLNLVKGIDKDVLRLVYKLHESGEETVIIVWRTSTGEHMKPVNVTGDSLSALARDVLKYL